MKEELAQKVAPLPLILSFLTRAFTVYTHLLGMQINGEKVTL